MFPHVLINKVLNTRRTLNHAPYGELFLLGFWIRSAREVRGFDTVYDTVYDTVTDTVYDTVPDTV